VQRAPVEAAGPPPAPCWAERRARDERKSEGNGVLLCVLERESVQERGCARSLAAATRAAPPQLVAEELDDARQRLRAAGGSGADRDAACGERTCLAAAASRKARRERRARKSLAVAQNSWRAA